MTASCRLEGSCSIPFLASSLGVRREQVVVGLGGQRVVLRQAAQPGGEDHREGEVGVAGAVGRPVLEPGRLGLAHLDDGHPHQRRAVVAGPADVDRRLVAADEPLVGVDPLVGHRGDLAGVVQQPGDEAARHLGEPVAVVLVDERVALALPQRDVGVHARALHAGQRLGHEGGEDALLARHLLDHHAGRHHGVGHGEGVGVAQVDLVLAARVLVLGVLDGDAHLLEHQHRAPAQVAREVGHGQVEVGAGVEGDRAPLGVGVGEVEELHLGRGEEGVAGGPGPLERPAQGVAGVTLERRAVEVGDVAEDAGHLRVVVVPGQQLEGLGVRAGQDVGLLDPAEAVDGRAVEGHALVERVLQLGRGDVEPLGGPQHVGEPQLDEADAPLLDGPEHVVPLALHRTSFACRGTALFRDPGRGPSRRGGGRR